MSEISEIKEIPEGTFPINLKSIRAYQQLEPKITDKNKYVTYQQGYFCGGSNIDIKLIACNDKIFIT